MKTILPPFTSQPETPPRLQTRPPWQQLRLMRESQGQHGATDIPFPLVELRGNRARLRALRAEELSAWDAVPSAETSRFIRRQLGA